MVARCMRLLRVAALSCVMGVSLSNAHATVEMELNSFWDDREPQSLINVDNTAFREILERYVATDHPSGIARFNYEAFSVSDKAKLEQYLEYLQFLEPRQLNDPEAKAYWINLYNAATLNLMIEEYQDGDTDGFRVIRSDRIASRPWRRNIITIAQQKLSLEDILNTVIRPMYKDPRVHFALFFCSLGGPNMPTEVFEGENNEELLNKFESEYLSQSRAVRMDQGQLVLSEIFSNFDTDFAPSQSGMIAYLRERVPAPVAEAMNSATSIRYEYDWGLNAP